MRKFATSFARRNGYVKETADLRDWWKGNRRHHDTFVDSTVTFPDAKMYTTLCKGGPTHYNVRENSG